MTELSFGPDMTEISDPRTHLPDGWLIAVRAGATRAAYRFLSETLSEAPVDAPSTAVTVPFLRVLAAQENGFVRVEAEIPAIPGDARDPRSFTVILRGTAGGAKVEGGVTVIDSLEIVRRRKDGKLIGSVTRITQDVEIPVETTLFEFMLLAKEQAALKDAQMEIAGAASGDTLHLAFILRAPEVALDLAQVTLTRFGDALPQELDAAATRAVLQQQGLPSVTVPAPPRIEYYIDPKAPRRLPLERLVAQFAAHDVISFDIFDTALVRAVAKPNDVFRIMGSRLGITDFVKKRKDAETYARVWNDRIKGSREVTLHEIYEVFAEQAGATAEWEALEKQLEIQLARPNPYIFEAYERLRAMGKTLVFTSDMYLPKETLEAMLARGGYTGYAHIYLSNEHGARKGDGTLQRILRAAYPAEQSIIHVGDVYTADFEKTVAAGLAAIHNPDQHGLLREPDMGSLAGSFYEAVIDNALGTGLWSEDIHYTHGFRTGGILALGYVEFLERLAREKGADKILFLGRDCDILFQIYQKFFGALPSDYVDISRSAALMLTANTNFNDYIGRTFFRWYDESGNSRPIRQLMEETGFGYLVPLLEPADIEPLQFPASASEARLREFFWANKSLIESQLALSQDAARDYFSAALGDARTVLLVDIGWTGTCIATLRDFFRSSLGDRAPQVFGALMGTSRNERITDAITDGSISAYVYSPVMNQDFARFIMPGGKIAQRAKDLLTLPVEYMFTEPKATAIGYAREASGTVTTLRGSNVPPNPEQIRDMQRGILDFVARYLDYAQGLAGLRAINAYTAFQPLRTSLTHRPYLYAVYKDFLYDAVSVLHGGNEVFDRFGDLFDHADQVVVGTEITAASQSPLARSTVPRILFISPEMTFMGAPHSLLRLCKVAAHLGYGPIVWTARPGPFAQEFEAHGFPVHAVKPSEVTPGKIEELVKDNVQLVVSNTVVTDEFVSAFEGHLPVVWYVREATNVPQFLRGKPGRAATLRRSSSVTVVSDYAAQAVGVYADGPIEVVKNAVEDIRHLARPYQPARDGVTRFVQLGTIEHRKGYDLCVAAYKAMPEAYRARSELHFAGGLINSGTSFASYLFGQTATEPGIHYHGLITDTQAKIELLSQMDVVMVASRDESCSLVALEGAMLSKPLIVTENVGAKYMVTDENGTIIPSGEVSALRDAYMRMIDAGSDALLAMGRASRLAYETRASMDVHRRELGALFARRIAAGPVAARPEPEPVPIAAVPATRELIVSLTSFPPRMPTIAACIESLRQQTRKPDRIILWLAQDQFPGLEADLPPELMALVDGCFEIRWAPEDLAPHKKYFHAMQAFPEALIVTVDDDVLYEPGLIAALYQGHLDRPHAVVAGRSNLIRFRPDGTLRTYDHWGYNHQHLREVETYALLPTGIGGVLFPPGALPPEAFDPEAIRASCLHADDLWLKVMTTINGYPTWMPLERFNYGNVEGSQVVALWRKNAFHNGNDLAMQAILDLLDRKYGIADKVLKRIQGLRPDGTCWGPGEALDRESLFSK